MLYHLFQYLEQHFQIPGAGLFQYISFRAALALISSLVISMLFGGTLVGLLRKMQIGETVRDLGLAGQIQKQGTPTMGGLIILGSILIPTLLFANLNNIYIITLLITTVWLGIIGFTDDYIKVFKKNKAGLAGKFKVIGQIGVGLIIGALLFFHHNVKLKHLTLIDGEKVWVESKAMVTTIPFMKNHEFNYQWLVNWLPNSMQYIALCVVFILIVIFIVTAISNGANMTDGLDGLATGTSAIIGVTLAIFAYVSGNTIFAEYLNIMYIPHSGEMVVYIAAFVGACVGFLWYNSYPAQVFMGDTGSLAIGGIIAVFAIAIRKEALLPMLCGVFLVENLSVMIQVSWFKFTKKKHGEGRRVFLMAPLHHHYQKLGMHESKIVSRFWIVGIMLAVLTLVTLKIR
jgi:phospho-N-acetylmuramoyl-pentapeptide-transferase